MNIKDIAKKAGVSQMTVSRVVNNKMNVKFETRQKVQKIIDKEKFVPHQSAKALRLGSNYSIGIFINFDVQNFYPSSLFFQEILMGISSELQLFGYTVDLFFDNGTEKKDKIISLLDSRQRTIDGLIVISNESASDLEEKIAHINLPIVVINKEIYKLNVDCILADDESGAYEAASHLYKLGHEVVGYIDGPSLKRKNGFLKATKDYNIKFNPNLIEVGFFHHRGGYLAMRKLLKKRHDISAVFAASDFMAVGALKAIREANLKIPDDISLVGFDDLELTGLIEPSLTTIKKPRKLMGKYSILTLLEKLKNNSKVEKKQKKIMLPTNLIIRKSTKPIN